MSADLNLNVDEDRVQPAFKPVLVPKPAVVVEKPKPRIKFAESKLAHQFLDGLTGLEIGGSAHNPFGLKNAERGFFG